MDKQSGGDMKKIWMGFALMFLSLNTQAGSAFDPPTPQILVTCQSQAAVIRLVELELMNWNTLVTRIYFYDGTTETYISREKIAQGNWPRVVNARQSTPYERVLSFDIMHPRSQFDYGVIELKGQPGTRNIQVVVNCKRGR